MNWPGSKLKSRPSRALNTKVSGITLSNVVIAGTTYNTSLTAPAT
ncbi:hypothetical protein [Paraburkholderia sp. EG304]